MKIRLERCGVVFEYEHQPMKEGRFRSLCALAGVVAYVGMITAVAALCGLPGRFVIAAASVLLFAIGKGMD